MNRVKRLFKNPYFVITLVYIASQSFLLLLNGCWWDDWTFMSHNLNYINEVATQTGRPEWNLLIPLAWSSPLNGRLLVFILYYLDALFLYNILKETVLVDEKGSLIITLLFILIPVNDARLLISNFSYTCGLFLFYLSLFLFFRWRKLEDGKKKTILRIGLLILFYFSLILNSLLTYYYLLFVYLFYEEYIINQESFSINKLYKAVKSVLFRYPDFFVIPLLFFTVKSVFFSEGGSSFEDYNTVSINGLIKSLIYIPISIMSIFSETINSWFVVNWKVLILVVMFVALYYLIIRNDNYVDEEKHNPFVYLFAALFALALGLLPYTVVRVGIVECTGIQGRDAILTPLGITFIFYAFISLFRGKWRKTVVSLFVILGIFAFNNIYLQWQKDYYYQLSMENKLNNEIIRNNDTFFLADLNESGLGSQRFYSLNTNAYHVYNDETRLFIPKTSNLSILENSESVKKTVDALDNAYMMKDYDPEDYNLDAIILYRCELSDLETISLRVDEIFNKDSFNKKIISNGNLTVIEVDDGFTKLLMDEYKAGRVKTDEEVLFLLMDYLN